MDTLHDLEHLVLTTSYSSDDEDDSSTSAQLKMRPTPPRLHSLPRPPPHLPNHSRKTLPPTPSTSKPREEKKMLTPLQARAIYILKLDHDSSLSTPQDVQRAGGWRGCRGVIKGLALTLVPGPTPTHKKKRKKKRKKKMVPQQY